jgi:hypothetical protein
MPDWRSGAGFKLAASGDDRPRRSRPRSSPSQQGIPDFTDGQVNDFSEPVLRTHLVTRVNGRRRRNTLRWVGLAGFAAGVVGGVAILVARGPNAAADPAAVTARPHGARPGLATPSDLPASEVARDSSPVITAIVEPSDQAPSGTATAADPDSDAVTDFAKLEQAVQAASRSQVVTFDIRPASAPAVITVDGNPIEDRSYALLPGPALRHVRVVVRAKGYQPWSNVLPVRGGKTVRIWLEPLRQTRGPGADIDL